MPFGILLLATGALSLIFGSAKTSDFCVDALKHVWTAARGNLSQIKRLVIDLDIPHAAENEAHPISRNARASGSTERDD